MQFGKVMLLMKSQILFGALVSCALSLSAEAAGVFYSFDTLADGTGGFTTGATTEIGLAGNSSFSVNGSMLSSGNAGGWTSPAAQNISGVTWIGTGGTGTPGHSAAINPDSTGNSYSLTLPTTALSQMSVSFNYRYAGAPATPAFTSFTYSINGGAATDVPGANLSLSASSPSSAFNTWSMDLSALTAINNQSTVTLTWNLPDFVAGRSFRMDNLQLVTIPEPGTAMLAGFATLLAGIRRRRRTL